MKVLKGVGNVAKGLGNFVLDYKLTVFGWYLVALIAASFFAIPVMAPAALLWERVLGGFSIFGIGSIFAGLVEIHEEGVFAERNVELRFWKDWGKNKNKGNDKGKTVEASEELKQELTQTDVAFVGKEAKGKNKNGEVVKAKEL